MDLSEETTAEIYTRFSFLRRQIGSSVFHKQKRRDKTPQLRKHEQLLKEASETVEGETSDGMPLGK